MSDENRQKSWEKSEEIICSELKSNEKDVRNAAIIKLDGMDDEVLKLAPDSIVEPLVVAARWGQKYKDEASRSAVNVLTKMGSVAVEPLLSLTEDDNYRTAQIACIALAKIGDPKFAPKGRAMLGAHIEGTNEYQALDAIEAMIQIGDEYVVDYLMQVALKTNPNEMIRANAAMALGRIGDSRAVPALNQALKDPSFMNVRPSVQWALKKLK